MLQLNFTPFPILETDRLRLRKLDRRDAPHLFDMRTDDRVNAFIDRPKPASLEDVEAFIDKIIGHIERNESINWMITLKDSDTPIGSIVYWNISPPDDQAEIGYELHPDFQGQGIMQEAMDKVIEYGFRDMKLKKINAFLLRDNLRSVRILEKNKFERDSVLEEAEEDLGNFVIYSRRAG